jgi:hypothetical protein
MGFTKKSFFKKIWLKFIDKPEYKRYKNSLNYHRGIEHDLKRLSDYVATNEIFYLEKIKQHALSGSMINFSHSGNAGDIIYSLPSLKSISEALGIPVRLFLKLNQPLDLPDGFSHPLGNVMLNNAMASMLLPLLKQQAYLNDCQILKDEPILVDLDTVRKSGIKLDRGSIARWYSYITGGPVSLSTPWLQVQANIDYSETIIIARSSRYQNRLIDYTFLNKYDRLAFVGVESEFLDLKRMIPTLEWVQVLNFLELAQIIAGCKFFIGNQSFPFSIAEGLKVPRILETYVDAPNVIPEGSQGFDFYFQEHFESVVARLNSLN